MIHGIGIDIIQISRMIKILDRRKRFMEKICQRILRYDEQEIIPNLKNKKEFALWICTKWAAKEAAFKAVNFQQKLKWKDIKICKYKNNQPYIQLWSEGKPTKEMKLSISHDGDYVIAFVAW
ncbi:holo-[acyl-carrier-protein] synthase [Pneumocystis carinii B80]|uniref:Holo-[acyl-carrier-protein] synthase n=1 Tax=Pneumocystis carinii (strain B80) TaxID=1408658 RepID=A0A0W4ZEI2_PNEC8|nr:holo-[acyl-carrier-protein] synthase [Pneumocystis carinii B80]KTW26788.1 holo-[acyl-carrier-protein] synthase [Pneumocystis carinii B80]